MAIFGHHTDTQQEQSATAPDYYDHQISLVDLTRQDEDHGGAQSLSESPTNASAVSRSQRFARPSLRGELARRKYAKWQEERQQPDPAQPSSSNNANQPETTDQPADTPASERTKTNDASRLQRGKQRVYGALNRKKASPPETSTDTEIDILHENQRGSFFFGIPLFSRQSLLNFDPAPWQTSAFRPSPVDITNAQVPDPSWEWAWKSWYVDMSGDVDEEGWQYSFSFQRGFSWHGTHPWFHSFVRRRRWLRKRVRRRGAGEVGKEVGDAHLLTAEYFTIHSRAGREGSRPASTVGSRFGIMEEEVEAMEEIRDIPTLMRVLRKAAIDREKIVAVKRFIDQGGDELYYLADQMPTIMSLLIFQSSRRQLLALLLHTFDAVSSSTSSSPSSSPRQRKTANLHNAVRAADEQVKRLEYWSDIRDMAREGETLGAADDGEDGEGEGEGREVVWGPEWQGVDTSGPGSAGQLTPTRPVGEEGDDGSEQSSSRPEAAPDEKGEEGETKRSDENEGRAGRNGEGDEDGEEDDGERVNKGKGRAD